MIWVAAVVTAAFSLAFVWLIVSGLEWYRRTAGIEPERDQARSVPPNGDARRMDRAMSAAR
jgi:hypothetical protein